MNSLVQHSKWSEAMLAREALAFTRRLCQIEKAIQDLAHEERRHRHPTDKPTVRAHEGCPASQARHAGTEQRGFTGTEMLRR
ncbi:MAG: hypothetical protein WBM65_01715 [Sedimenticolaceae bacterium]